MTKYGMKKYVVAFAGGPTCIFTAPHDVAAIVEAPLWNKGPEDLNYVLCKGEVVTRDAVISIYKDGILY